MDLEQGADYLQVLGGSPNPDQALSLATLTGSLNIDRSIYSPNNYMLVVFRTDQSNAGNGFTARFSSGIDHWNPGVMMPTLSSPAAPDVVDKTGRGTITDDKFDMIEHLRFC